MWTDQWNLESWNTKCQGPCRRRRVWMTSMRKNEMDMRKTFMTEMVFIMAFPRTKTPGSIDRFISMEAREEEWYRSKVCIRLEKSNNLQWRKTTKDPASGAQGHVSSSKLMIERNATKKKRGEMEGEGKKETNKERNGLVMIGRYEI